MTRPRITAALTAAAAAPLRAAAQDATASADGLVAAGRWRLNAGSEMTMYLPQLDAQRPVRVVIDMASVKPITRCAAIADHDSGRIVGAWSNITASPDGLDADLGLMVPQTPEEGAGLADAVRARAQIRAQIPLQCSVGCTAEYEEVTAPIEVNGRTLTPPVRGDLRLFVARSADLQEGSLVLRGADSETGKLAAHAHHHGTVPMLDLKKIKTTYADRSPALRAAALEAATEDGATDATVEAAVLRAELADVRGQLKAAQDTHAAALKAKDAEIASLKASASAGAGAAHPPATHLGDGGAGGDTPATDAEILARNPHAGRDAAGKLLATGDRMSVLRAGVFGGDGKRLTGAAALRAIAHLPLVPATR